MAERKSMPSESGAQHRLMEMVAHGGEPDKVKGPPKKVAKEFVKADKKAGKKFSASKEKAKVEALRKPHAPKAPEVEEEEHTDY